ncbi:MAG: RluA family pseudouridine synthase, partial [candidate division NC10 bacterium]|nr:RluA family pseudouridine synthase [candidate division NC10 bacterium]
MEEVLEFTIDPDSVSGRLDVIVAKASGLSRAKVQRLIEEGHVLVDGRPRKAGFKPSPGQKIHLSFPPPEPGGILPEPIPLKILYEDDDLLVIDKPPGLVVHPGAGHKTGTLVHALLHHSPEIAAIGEKGRPGIVHRLDKDTSGVMVVAKTEVVKRSLQQQFKERTVKKTYLALVRRAVREDQGRIELPIDRHEADRKRMGVGTKKGREAATAYQVLQRFPEFTLLLLHPETGRTHQIRVHLA